MLMLYSGPIQHSLCIFWLPYYKEVWVDKLTFTRVEMETEQRKIERQGDRSYAVAAWQETYSRERESKYMEKMKRNA